MRIQRLLRTLAFAHALTRTTLASSLALSPSRVATSWLGEDVSAPGGRIVLNAFAIRDFLIGCSTLYSLRRGLPVRRIFLAGIAIELVELASTLSLQNELDEASPEIWNALALVGVIGGAILALGLDDEAQRQLAKAR